MIILINESFTKLPNLLLYTVFYFYFILIIFGNLCFWVSSRIWREILWIMGKWMKKGNWWVLSIGSIEEQREHGRICFQGNIYGLDFLIPFWRIYIYKKLPSNPQNNCRRIWSQCWELTNCFFHLSP